MELCVKIANKVMNKLVVSNVINVETKLGLLYEIL